MMALAAALLKTGEAMELCSELDGPLVVPDPTEPVLRLAPPPPTNGGLLSLLGELKHKNLFQYLIYSASLTKIKLVWVIFHLRPNDWKEDLGYPRNK